MKKFNNTSHSNAKASSINLNDISIKSILNDVSKQILIIILCCVVGFCGAFIAKNEAFVPEYKSEATFMVSTKDGSSDAYANLMRATQMNEVLKLIIDSSALQDTVKNDLGKEKLNATINANMIENTNLLELSVTAKSPKESYDTLCSVIRSLPIFAEEIMDEITLYTFDLPSVPTHKGNTPNSTLFGVLGALIGLVLSLAIIIYLSIKKDTIKTYKQVNEKLTGRLISSIPAEKVKANAPLISNISTSFEYKEAFNELRSKIVRDSRNNGNKSYAICSAAHGEGKTTITINLATSLAKQGYKAVLIDMEYNKPIIYDMLGFEVSDEQDFQSSFYGNEFEDLSRLIIKNRALKIDMILSTIGYNDVNRAVVYDRLKIYLDKLKNDYDFIIVDTASIDSVVSIDNVINACDTSALIVREDYEKTKKINDALDTLTVTGKASLGVILNFSNAKKSSAYGYAYYGGYKKYSAYDTQKNSPS